MIKYSILGAILFILMAFPCYADPDFYFVMDSCKTIAGALSINKEGVKTFEGNKYMMACERHSKDIKCTTTFQKDKSGKDDITRTYSIKMDYPTLLVITDENHADYIVSNPSTGGAVVITRVVGETFAGSKVCQGMYLTSSEMKDFMER